MTDANNNNNNNNSYSPKLSESDPPPPPSWTKSQEEQSIQIVQRLFPKSEVLDEKKELQKEEYKKEVKKLGLQTSSEISTHKASTEIASDEVKIYYEIGHGSFGRVYAGICRGTEVAVKYLLNVEKITQRQINNFRKEIQILSNVQHKNVVLYLGAHTENEPFFIVTEKMSDSVGRILREKTELKTSLRISMARDCAVGMAWLHGSKPQILHRDLKPDNLLIDDDWNVKVCDFGLSQVKLEDEKIRDKKRKGSPLWMSPEVMMDKDVDEKADIYSFGLILWEIITGCQLFPEFISFPSFKLAVCRNNMRPEIKTTNIQGDEILPTLNELMQLCWQKEPKSRPSFPEILYQLELIFVDSAISDPEGSLFWKESFGGKKNVEWSVFQDYYVKKFPAHDPAHKDTNFECLKRFICTSNPHPSKIYDPFIVTIENFSLFLNCFGPLGNGASALSKLKDCLFQPWFHGDISRTEANIRLQMASTGTFLVRTSITEKTAPFTLTIKSKEEEIKNIRIHKADRKLSMSWMKESFSEDNLVDLIKACMLQICLTKPCLGSQFQDLFIKKGKLKPYDPYAQSVDIISQKDTEIEDLTNLLNDPEDAELPDSDPKND